MIEIKDLLAPFEKILLGEEIKKEAIREVLYKNIGILIDIKNIEIKKNNISLNIKPIYKNEILIKKERIFYDLSIVLGKAGPQEIR